MAKAIEITPIRCTKLNAQTQALTGAYPAAAAAQLARLMRLYGLKEWDGHKLWDVDERANGAVEAFDVEISSRHWLGTSHEDREAPPLSTHGNRILGLYTPSGQKALVLRQVFRPEFPPSTQRTGLLANIAIKGTPHGPTLEIHRHTLPFKLNRERLWETCCEPSYMETYKVSHLIQLTTADVPTLVILDALYAVWTHVIGKAVPVWRRS